jgi:hypothetical protein
VLGGDAGNYISPARTTIADITPKAITVGGITASNKVYDATTAAILNTTGASFSGLVGSDSVGVTGTGQFADKNVGTAKPVAITSLALDGADAGNYTVTTSAAPTADITPRALTAGGISATSKVYDGSTAATLDTSAGRLTSGVQGADDVSLVASAASGSFASKNVGVAKAVTVSGLALGGADAGNYTIGDAAAFADITAKALTASGIVAANKVYDGTRVASLDTTGAVLAGVVQGDSVGIVASGVTGSLPTRGWQRHGGDHRRPGPHRRRRRQLHGQRPLRRHRRHRHPGACRGRQQHRQAVRRQHQRPGQPVRQPSGRRSAEPVLHQRQLRFGGSLPRKTIRVQGIAGRCRREPSTSSPPPHHQQHLGADSVVPPPPVPATRSPPTRRSNPGAGVRFGLAGPGGSTGVGGSSGVPVAPVHRRYGRRSGWRGRRVVRLRGGGFG